MKNFAAILSLTLSLLPTSITGAAESLKPDSQGYIRHWLMLAPIVFPEGLTGADLIYNDQIKNEAALLPKAGDKLTINGKELIWKPVTASTNYFDFNATLQSLSDRAMGYMVTYIQCDDEMPGLVMALGSNDQGRLYLNGVDIYLFAEPRTLELDADKGRVTLQKGLNVIVFKIFNEQGNWQGSMRFMDKSGAPLTNLKIKLSP
ncbi:MAG TPA: hypothetical protein VM680_00215 [Verrucomicrobiae bacterium]|nr:hypothetical protein [Verrucomicrobiae bacterium]